MYSKGIFSDHASYYLAIKLVEEKRGCGYWKLNTNLLSNKEYLVKINELCEATFECEGSSTEYGPDFLDKWDQFKKSVADLSKEFSREVSSELTEVKANLSEKIVEMEDQLEQLSEDELTLLLKSKEDLDEIMMTKTAGIIFRSKCKWINEGERNTKYFLNLEKQRATARTTYCILTDEGEEITEGKGYPGSSRILLCQTLHC